MKYDQKNIKLDPYTRTLFPENNFPLEITYGNALGVALDMGLSAKALRDRVSDFDSKEEMAFGSSIFEQRKTCANLLVTVALSAIIKDLEQYANTTELE